MSFTNRLPFGVILFFIGVFFFVIFSIPATASGNLENARDLISSDAALAENVGHTVSFTLPYDSDNVVSSDYILIYLTHYHDITAPTGISGDYMGTPQYSIDGNVAKITGIFIEHGGSVTITGITATNPSSPDLLTVQIVVAEDSEGNIIKNIATFGAFSQGATVSVTASVAPAVATLVISGYAAPSTFITFTENGTVIGTTTAGGSNGYFIKHIAGLDPATHSVSLYGVDIYHRTTSIIPIQIYTPIYQETTVSNLLLSPTMAVSDSEITQGDVLILQGMAIPDGDINIFTESPLRSYYATASAAGNWNYTISNTNDYTAGDYRVYTLVTNGTGLQSLFGNSVQFTVLPSSGPVPSDPACDISEGDLNCDSNINLADFSILMYYWGTSNAAADINEDDLVNLTDFSIMMYYWGT
jgi:hypothetical protein